MTDDQIKAIVNRFLMWKLPHDFSPDDGISFDLISNQGSQYERRREPTGTNLFNASQAEAMVRYMLEGTPPLGAPSDPDALCARTVEALAVMADYAADNFVSGHSTFHMLADGFRALLPASEGRG